ncbi:FHA domain-containing protein [Kitasatospora misakiensis]|uniref:FHA domain-containing protein n=1 Tax=Kitasatospora misakiensis TaxID=67330 RepID=A0ABW0XJ02_9ACTN
MRPIPEHQDLPRLIIDSPEELRGRVYELAGRPLLLGRDDECQIRVGDPKVSRHHAVVRWSDGRTTVEDLESTNGTRLNGHRLLGQQVLHAGDVIDFGPVELHYEEPNRAATTVLADPEPAGSEALTETVGPTGTAGPTESPGSSGDAEQYGDIEPGWEAEPYGDADPVADTDPGGTAVGPVGADGRNRVSGMAAAAEAWSGVSPAVEQPPFPPRPPEAPGPPPAPPPPPPPVLSSEARRSESWVHAAPRFDVDRQSAENISNVARDQIFTQYITMTDHRREAFFRKVADWRTRGRHLVMTGFIVLLVGCGVSGWAVRRLPEDIDQPGLSDLTGVKFGGVPIGGIGFTLATAGLVLFLLGITVYVVTAVRVRRFERNAAQPSPPDRRTPSRA